MDSRRIFFLFWRSCLAAMLASSVSCAFFYRPPALPRHAAIESDETPRADEKFAALIQTADIIYFPTELLGSAAQSESAPKLVLALQRSGSSFAIAWDLIGGEEQALLDLWTKGTIPTQTLISRLHLPGTARERESCRVFLRETAPQGVRLLALRCPADLLSAAPSEPDEAAMVEQEFTAERIVGHFRTHRDEKLLVFVHRRLLEGPGGVPNFVARKIKARQLILDLQPHQSRSQLLTLR